MSKKSNALYNLFLRNERWHDTRPIRKAWNDGWIMGQSEDRKRIVNLENTLRDLDRKMLADGIDSSKAYWHETIMGLLFPKGVVSLIGPPLSDEDREFIQNGSIPEGGGNTQNAKVFNTENGPVLRTFGPDYSTKEGEE